MPYGNLGLGSGSSASLSTQSDVAIASAAVSDVLRYANGKWRDAVPGRLNLWDFILDQLAGAAYVPSYRIYGCSITSGQAVLTAGDPQFTASMVGQTVHVDQAGAAGGVLVTTIQAYTSATQVTLAATAGSTVSLKGVARVIGTEVTTAIDAWLTALGTSASTSPGGAMGLVPPMHLLTAGNHQIPNDVWLEGCGEWRSLFMLKASAGANVDVFRSSGFSGYTGQTGTANANKGAHGFGLARMTLDGNFRQNSAARYGLAIYGFDYFLKDLVVTHCKGSGIYSELNMTNGNTPHQLGTGPGGLHAYWDRVAVMNCADTGTGAQVRFNGPHDSYVRGLDVYKDGNFSDYGIWIGASGVGGGVDGGGGSQWSDIHVWGNHTTGVYLNSGGTLMDNVQSEGGNLQMLIAGSKIKVSHARLYGVTGTSADEGLELATSASDGQVTNLKVENCDVCAVRFTGSGGTNYKLSGTASSDNAAPPPLVNAAPPASCDIDLDGQAGYDRSLKRRAGYAVANTDVALAAGWGTTASVAVKAGSNVYRGELAITSGGTGQAATPTATLTFPKSFVGVPYVVCARINTPSGSSSFFSVGTVSASAVQFFYSGTPAGGTTYTLHYWVVD